MNNEKVEVVKNEPGYDYNVKYLTEEGWKQKTIRAIDVLSAKIKAYSELPNALEIRIF